MLDDEMAELFCEDADEDVPEPAVEEEPDAAEDVPVAAVDDTDDADEVIVEDVLGEAVCDLTADDADSGETYRDKTIKKQSNNAANGFFIPSSYALRYFLIETELDSIPTRKPVPRNDSKTVAATFGHGIGFMLSSDR